MNFIESGAQHDKVILLLHGGGLAPWNYVEEAALLQEKYHILLPVLNGHNSSGCAFTTIEDAACRIIAFIDEHFDGKVFLIGGLSLGGQILIEMLSQRKNICQYAIIESALVLPMRATARLIKPTYELCYSLIKKRWFARLQFASLHIQPALFEAYFRDSSAISRSNMTAFLMANADYKAKPSLADCNEKLLVLVGEKVAAGGSMTLFEAGIIDHLNSGKYHHLDRYAKDADTYQVMREAFFADTYLTSTNALTEEGELYNVDGNGNRVAAMLFGPKQVIVVAGYNKNVADMEAACRRIEKIAAPANVVRLGLSAPCSQTGECMHCHSEGRICCDYVRMGMQRTPGRIKVIIVGEPLGY